MATCKVIVQHITGARHELALEPKAQGDAVYAAAAVALARPPDTFSLVLRGAPVERGPAPVRLKEGDTLLAAPRRRAPDAALQAAAREAAGVSSTPGGGDDDDDDAPLRFTLPANAPAWHRALAGALRSRCNAPDLLLLWLFAAGPGRLLAAAGVLAGARAAHVVGWGPQYVLVAGIVVIFTHLGRRREGEASAYSVFNDGRRLPGQLDADMLDEQLRRGQL